MTENVSREAVAFHRDEIEETAPARPVSACDGWTTHEDRPAHVHLASRLRSIRHLRPVTCTVDPRAGDQELRGTRGPACRRWEHAALLRAAGMPREARMRRLVDDVLDVASRDANPSRGRAGTPWRSPKVHPATCANEHAPCIAGTNRRGRRHEWRTGSGRIWTCGRTTRSASSARSCWWPGREHEPGIPRPTSGVRLRVIRPARPGGFVVDGGNRHPLAWAQGRHRGTPRSKWTPGARQLFIWGAAAPDHRGPDMRSQLASSRSWPGLQALLSGLLRLPWLLSPARRPGGARATMAAWRTASPPSGSIAGTMPGSACPTGAPTYSSDVPDPGRNAPGRENRLGTAPRLCHFADGQPHWPGDQRLRSERAPMGHRNWAGRRRALLPTA